MAFYERRLSFNLTWNLNFLYFLVSRFSPLVRSLDASSIIVHVISGGEHQAAMKHGNNSASSLSWQFHPCNAHLLYSSPFQALLALKSSTILLCLIASSTFNIFSIR
jgi:hypothetical protein